MIEEVVLVNRDDIAIGVSEKSRAHRLGLRHRAISVVIESSSGEWLLQRRAPSKYHSGGLWSNACCGHPRPGETVEAAAQRKLREELGIGCALTYCGRVIYSLPVSEDMTENEVDHVFVGAHQGPIAPDPAEIDAIRWVGRDRLLSDLRREPWAYSKWLPEVLSLLGLKEAM